MVELLVPEGYSWFFVQDATDEIDELLFQEMRYYQEGAEYSTSYKKGTWDGYVNLYKKEHSGGPRGLIDRAVDALEDEGYEVEVTVEGHRHGDAVDLEWNFEHDLREYQRDAVTAVLENRGGIVGAATGSGKTVTALRLLYQLRMSSGRGIVFVHTKELLYQWADEIRDILGVEPGLIGDGQWTEGPVTVAIMQTLVSRGVDDLRLNYGVGIFDECHRTSAADTMHDIGMNIEFDYRIGLSATPWRRVQGEEMKIEGAVGGQVISIDAPRLIEQGYLAEPVFETITHDGPTTANGEDYHDAYRRCIEQSEPRNAAVAGRAAELASDGHKVLVNVNRVEQGQRITQRLDAKFLSGSDGTERREEVLDEFEHGDLDILVSTLIKEGNDIPNISALINAHAGKSDIATIQLIGRALRPSDHDKARIVDVRDTGRYFGDAFKARQDTMREYYDDYYNLGFDKPDTDERQERTSLTREMGEDEQDELLEEMGFK